MTNIIQFSTNNQTFYDSYEYRGEGNAHLALSILEMKKIMLIKKVQIEEITNTKNFVDSIAFHNRIMKPLLDQFVSEVEKADLDQKQITEIESNILLNRPSFRLDKTLSHMCAALMDDYTRYELPISLNNVENVTTVAFEIKPKPGIDIDGKCKFCFKQQRKLEANRIKTITGYCPKDLYSRDMKLPRKAIEALLENPQNNLQVYINSKLIHSEGNNIQDIKKNFTCWKNPNITETIIQLLTKILHYEFVNISQCDNCKHSKYTVLDCLTQLQELDSNNTPPESSEKGYVKMLLSALETNDRLLCKRCKVFGILKSPLIKHYISKIARDCSIMITVKQLPKNLKLLPKDVHAIEMEDMYYIFNVNVLDLLPKVEK